MSARRLVVTGDDFGVAPEVNAAIIGAHREGILTSTSLMVTGAVAVEAVALAREHPRLAVGLHLVLAQGSPVSPPAAIPGLVRDGGEFGRQPVLAGLRYAWQSLHRVGRDQLRREIEGQLAAFAATGLPLSHVDGHLNMHLHPMVLPVLISLAPRYGIRAMRLTREELIPALRYDARHPVRKIVEGTIFGTLSRYAAPRLRAAGIVATDRIYGMHQTGHVDERYLLDVITHLPTGASELYCHPATSQPPVMAPYQPGYDHAAEVAALTSPRVRTSINARGVELIGYPDITAR